MLFPLLAQEEFSVEIEPFVIDEMPEVHSYSWAKTTNYEWLIFGGRLDGLHQRQPFAAFQASENNLEVSLVNLDNNLVVTTSLSSLSAPIFEQLQSTNQNFYQRGNTLYIIGGYGYSATLLDHITYPNLIAIDVDGLATAIKNNTSITAFFRQIAYTNFAVTGGQLAYLDSTFYLCGGQLFEGRYNPMGPNNGPGFIQQYTDEIRTFKIVDDGINLSVQDYNAQNDPANLHRRDYNMSPQVFPNGTHGFTMFSGVFDASDLPFLNSVDIMNGNYTVNNSFNQYLSHYHSGKVPVYDSINNTMHTVFFGGMSQYTMDTEGVLTQDDEVPFVKTISVVTRNSDGTMEEKMLDIEMPAFLGSGAEFIPITDENIFLEKEIVKLNNINGRTLVGYIYGGIESSAKNIFFSNTGVQSNASSQIFKVYISKKNQATTLVEVNTENTFEMEIFPNPSAEFITLKANFSKNSQNTVVIYDLAGKEIKRQEIKKLNGTQEVNIDISNISRGDYIILLKNKEFASKLKFYIF